MDIQQLSHVISDLVLSAVGFFVFFRYLLKLDLLPTILWESFILSVAIAALLGAIRYAGYPQAAEASVFFQKLASTVGAFGLLTASYQLVTGRYISNMFGYFIIGLGFVLLAISEFMNFDDIRNGIAMVCLPLVALMGIFALMKGKMKIGLYLLAGAGFAAASVAAPYFLESTDDGIDAYHYLLAISVLCFGLAASQQPKTEEIY